MLVRARACACVCACVCSWVNTEAHVFALQASWFMKEDVVQPADGDDEMQDTLAMGWRITEVEPHSCQLVQAQQQEGGGGGRERKVTTAGHGTLTQAALEDAM